MEAKLADLLQLSTRRKRQAASSPKTGDAAQILIFTGVRYSRDTPPSETSIDAKRRKRKRV